MIREKCGYERRFTPAIPIAVVLLLAALWGGLWAEGRAYNKNVLYFHGRVREFTGDALRTIALPIGGIATGNITLGGRGNIQELEIFNKPAKNVLPDLTFFSIWVQEQGKEPVAKILERKYLPPFTGGGGFPRSQLAGVSRFDEAVFRGEFPFAYLTLKDGQVPLEISLEAYNPFIPLAPEKSSVPAAVFNWNVRNPGRVPLKVSLAFSMLNPIRTRDASGNLGFGRNLNQFFNNGKMNWIRLNSNRADTQALEFGNLAMATSEQQIQVLTRWYRGGWWDNAHRFWDDFSQDGLLEEVRDGQETAEGGSDAATLLVRFELQPGEEKVVPFYLAWYFPNRENYWNGEPEMKGKRFKNFYATMFKSADDAAAYLVEQAQELYGSTRRFHDILFNSSFPAYVIDAVSSQASSLKTNLVAQDENGNFYGFEGLDDSSGCCMGTCTHVWNYEQTLAFLFPSLERSLRETAFLHDTFANGYQTFRTLFPAGNAWWKFKPAADGQMGNIVRVFREWKLSGDTAWMKKLWPKVKRALEFAWTGVGQVGESEKWQKERLTLPWDANRDGVLEGEQHNTYDIEFYGPNTMTGSLYLAALKAGAEMAEAVGEHSKASEYRKIYESGKQKYERLLWNGDYYIQKVEVAKGLTVPESLRAPESEKSCCAAKAELLKKNALEPGQTLPKYQYGEGCLSDQLLGQYLAHVSGLGYVLNPEHVDRTMKTIFASNFRNDISSFSNVQRIYAINHEAGLLVCSWPKGNRPVLPFPYCDEVWTGCEYQVAAGLIYSGLVDEGLSVVKAARDRYDGASRNPWDEFECGHHYARAMASWAVLLALSGYRYDGVTHSLSFSPRISREDFRSFWSTGNGWGNITIRGKKLVLTVAFGTLKLAQLGVARGYGFQAPAAALLDGKEIAPRLRQDSELTLLVFTPGNELKTGDTLSVDFK